MQVTFVSNYINHHQMPFCEAMQKQTDGAFTFIQTEPMEPQRIAMGWQEQLSKLPFVLCYYENPEQAARLILESDVVLFGGTDDESYIAPRLRTGKLVIRISERIYKEGQWKFLSPRGLCKKYKDHIRYRRKEVYLLCAGGYVASDFHLIGAYTGKMYAWGYFPRTEEYTADELQDCRAHETVEILWAGRMISWKHPEAAVHLVETLLKRQKEAGRQQPFHLTMIGGGEMEAELRALVSSKNLMPYVTFAGFMEPGKVRQKMLSSDIFIFTSDYREGWGAVLNEAMNSGCAVVASSGIGAVPFLLQHGKNGMVYQNGREAELADCVEELLSDKRFRQVLGLNAYETIHGVWNAENAAERLIRFIRSVQLGNPEAAPYGPLMKAPVISPRCGYAYTGGGRDNGIRKGQ